MLGCWLLGLEEQPGCPSAWLHPPNNLTTNNLTTFRTPHALLPLLLLAVTLSACARREEALPVLGRVPAFSLRASDGRERSERDLKGSIWVADFIFTHCPGVCPLLSAQMARLQHALEEEDRRDVRLVSFSVDPARDTPEVLRVYAQRWEADPQRWLFLTGERDALYTLIGKGFQLAVAERTAGAEADPAELITHSDRFVLVDRDLRIRGYYRPLEEEGLTKLVADISRLRE